MGSTMRAYEKDEKAMNPEPLDHKWIHTKHCDGDVFATKQK
jgi:hypothetical protein